MTSRPTSLADPITVFLDANILAKPLTRTLLIVGGPLSGFVPAWSAQALAEADRHLGPAKTSVADLSARFDWSVSPTGSVAGRFGDTAASDRQLLADAETASAHYLVSEDVDDFAESDLISVGISGVNPDLFLAVRLSPGAYHEALATIGHNWQRPPSTPAEIHPALGRNHPILATRFASLYPTQAAARVQAEPATIFRGARCLRCGKSLSDPSSLERGLGPECENRAGHRPRPVSSPRREPPPPGVGLEPGHLIA